MIIIQQSQTHTQGVVMASPVCEINGRSITIYVNNYHHINGLEYREDFN